MGHRYVRVCDWVLAAAHTRPCFAQSWDLPTLRQYFQWIRSTFNPQLTPDAESVIMGYYQAQRRAADRQAARTTLRMLNACVRLAQVHAATDAALSHHHHHHLLCTGPCTVDGTALGAQARCSGGHFLGGCVDNRRWAAAPGWGARHHVCRRPRRRLFATGMLLAAWHVSHCHTARRRRWSCPARAERGLLSISSIFWRDFN